MGTGCAVTICFEPLCCAGRSHLVAALTRSLRSKHLQLVVLCASAQCLINSLSSVWVALTFSGELFGFIYLLVDLQAAA